ncbi:YwdK [Paenibacillus mucilaginosus 3016]|uniref:YwdK n=1 Tax=Paenibacillus mucilaginosus 3016 TaxID=1116391 RepID=H6NEL6_9BACL|nr:YwdK [Paenibacillus mucilaginosus 3016]
MKWTFIRIGAICGFLAVAIGAFGAHMVKENISAAMFANYQTGVQYHMFHALALTVIGLASAVLPATGHLRRAGWAMLTGIIIFSGSLYVMALTDLRILGAITPIGGVAFCSAGSACSWPAEALGLPRSNMEAIGGRLSGRRGRPGEASLFC